MTKPIILSLFDYSGIWASPYVSLGYEVVRVDTKLTTGLQKDGSFAIGVDIYKLDLKRFENRNLGMLLAPPCTDFAGSGARYWKEKDQDGRTNKSVLLIKYCLHIVDTLKPKFWALENPVGRIAKLVPELGIAWLIFDPCVYAGYADEPKRDAYNKKTLLYGKFNNNLVAALVPPIFYESGGKYGSRHWRFLGGKSEKTKELRSMTPQGFARAFAVVNRLD